MNSELTQKILDLQDGDHLCLFYEKDPAEQMPALIPFVQDALSRDEQFIYIADDQTIDDFTWHLEQSGINTDLEKCRKRLLLWTRREWRQPGELESARKASQVREIIDHSLREGFKGIRLGVEMTWTLGPEIETPALQHWESTLNTIFHPGMAGRIICQYNRSRLAPATMIAALRTHPIAIIGTDVFPNPYYEPHESLSGNGNSDVKRLDWMIHQLHRARQAEKWDRELKLSQETERKLTLQYTVARILAESTQVNQALSRVLEALCTHSGREFGAVWLLDHRHDFLRCSQVWEKNPGELREFVDLSRKTHFEIGSGLPGRVWLHRKPTWIPDLGTDSNFPRSKAALRDGLRSGTGFPIQLEGRVLGAVEVFSRSLQICDSDFLQMLNAVGRQLGQFIERRKAEDEMAHLGAIVASSDDAVVGKNLDGIIQSWNEAATRLFGYTADEMVGKSITTLIPPDRLDEETRILEKLRAGQRINHFETVRVRKDGTPIDVSLSISPILSKDGAVIGAAKIARDITGRKNADRAKDHFLASLSHELRTPLMPVLMNVSLLRQNRARERSSELLDSIERNIQAQVRLVDELLDMSRIVHRKFDIRREPCRLNDIVRQSLERFELRFRDYTVRLEFSAENDSFVGDQIRLQQVFSNLIENAIKFTPAGGTITILTANSGPLILFCIQDTGQGIEGDPSRLFHPFEQERPDVSIRQGGLGLGLAISKAVVEAHGGIISARSKGRNQGATFEVRIPIVPEPDKSPAAESLPETFQRMEFML